MGTVVTGFSGPVAAVFLLAENRLLREALLRILSKKDDIRVVGAGSYGPDMFEQIVATQANVVVLDSVSPVLAEHGVVRELHQLNPAMRVVMVGMEADEAVFLRVVQAGAVGYVLKDASAVEVARTIRAVAAGEAVCPAALSVSLFQWVARHTPAIPNLHLKTSLGLSRREQQLVGLIQQGLTNKEMASRLNLSEQTVKNHVHRMLRKVGAPDRLSIVEVCRKDQHVRQDLFDDVRQVALVLDLAHDLNVGLVGNRSHHQFPHQTRMICDQHADSFHKEIPSAEHRSRTLQAQGSIAIYADSRAGKGLVPGGTIGEVLRQVQEVPSSY